MLYFVVCLVMVIVMGVAVISCYIDWDTEFQAPTPNSGGALSQSSGPRCMSDTVLDCTTKGRDISAPRLPPVCICISGIFYPLNGMTWRGTKNTTVQWKDQRKSCTSRKGHKTKSTITTPVRSVNLTAVVKYNLVQKVILFAEILQLWLSSSGTRTVTECL